MKIALIGNASNTMLLFRGSLIAELRLLGHEVLAICPINRESDIVGLTNLGARHIPLEDLSPHGINPISEIRLLYRLKSILHREKPESVLTYFLKPVIWGAFAAHSAGVPRTVGMIEGMGSAFSIAPSNFLGKLKQLISRNVIKILLFFAVRKIDRILVLNQHDADLVRSAGKVAGKKLSIIDGIGIDLDYFEFSEPPLIPFRFTLVARMIPEKGVHLFAEAAARVLAVDPTIKFRLVGGSDNSRKSVTTIQLEEWVEEGRIEWLDEVSDVRPYLRDTSVFVLPTRYSEGLPRSIMEAMSMGRPVITSSMPGAKDSITHNVSGVVLPTNDVDALVNCCIALTKDPERVLAMGKEARDEAERRYDLHRQNNKIINILIG